MIAVAVLVGLLGGMAVRVELVGDAGGVGVARVGVLIGMAVALCAAPVWKEVERKKSTGVASRKMLVALRMQFVRLMRVHAAYAWFYASISVIVLMSYFRDLLTAHVAFSLLGVFALGLFLASISIARRMKSIWEQFESISSPDR